ncbi:hypothetical protein ANCDUO_07822 [Ancylostoma duodenale]|uniref:Uncharacterized protein n=1 Tax=Ancylostoma duodenale TaxID=51022 RepID=A0A0C2GSB9_9BILA|nr:hypothetical protein ANCDUO_07822 [Ancylostoma duodenale]
MATTSAHHDDEGKLVEARLTLNMKEPRRKTSEDTYVMEVVEVAHSWLYAALLIETYYINDNDVTVAFQTHIDDCDCFNFGDPHVIICALGTDDKSNALYRIDAVRNKVESQEWTCPVILLAYHNANAGSVPYDVMRELKALSRNPRIFRCMEATALGRNLLRHCLAIALLAARPFLAEIRAEKDVCIDDGSEKQRVKPRRPQSEERSPNLLHRKPSFRKSCRIQ